MWILTSLNRPVGLAMVPLAIFRLKGAGDGFGSPSLQCSSSVMTLTPDPPSKRTSSTTFLPMQIEITGMCLLMASVAAISFLVVGILLGGATTCRSTKTQVNPSSALNRTKHHQSNPSNVPGILDSNLSKRACVYTSKSLITLSNRIPSL